MGFPHDFPLGSDFETAFPEVKAKYDRRIKRLIEDIEKNNDILIVYVLPPPEAKDMDISDQILSEGYKKITARFPNKNIDFLYIACADEHSERNIGEHIKKIYFDFTRPNNNPPYNVKKLRTLVNDYRLRQTLSDRFRNFKYKMKKRFKRWKAKAARYLTFRPSL